MRTRTVTICILVALCLCRALTFRGSGGPGDAGRPGASGGTDGARHAAGRPAAWPFCGRSPPCDGVRPPRDAWSAVVRRVVDGDTVILLVHGRPVRVRLIGADAPEIWHRRDCLGADAAHALRGLLPPGSRVRAAGDREAVDRYGRRLLYLWTLDRRTRTPTTPRRTDPTRRDTATVTPHASMAGTRTGSVVARTGWAVGGSSFVEVVLIRAGLARAMYVSPNTRYAAAMRAAEAAARRARAGLWAACTGRAPRQAGWAHRRPAARRRRWYDRALRPARGGTRRARMSEG